MESCEVDIKQQKVVVTGNVDVGALLKMLVKKTGKHAELLPEVGTIHKTKKKKKKAVVQDDEESQSVQENRAEEERVSNCEEELKRNSETGQTEEQNAEIGSDAPPSAAVNVEEGKKNKSKGQKGNEKIHIPPPPPLDHKDKPPSLTNIPPRQQSQTNGQTSSAPPLADHIPPRHPAPSTSLPANTATAARYNQHSQVDGQTSSRPPFLPNHVPPRHQGTRLSYHYPQPQQQPVYSMSYNVAPRPPTSAAYGYQSSVGYRPRPYRLYDDEVEYDAYGYRQQQPESFGMFSDENPNACSIV